MTGSACYPSTSLSQTLAIFQQLQLLQGDGASSKVFLQFYQKMLVTVVINANFDIKYEQFGSNREVSRSYSTRLAEVENFGETEEHEMPVADGHSYLWLLYSYWRFEEQDGAFTCS